MRVIKMFHIPCEIIQIVFTYINDLKLLCNFLLINSNNKRYLEKYYEDQIIRIYYNKISYIKNLRFYKKKKFSNAKIATYGDKRCVYKFFNNCYEHNITYLTMKDGKIARSQFNMINVENNSRFDATLLIFKGKSYIIYYRFVMFHRDYRTSVYFRLKNKKKFF